jgi:DMSO/TMAO reductase YedYZ molybdopterin-dependent catalytic subunit
MKSEDYNKQKLPTEAEPYDKGRVNRRTFISSFTLLAGGTAAYFGWDWLYNSPKETTGVTARAHKPLRGVLDANGKLFEGVVSPDHLVRTYPKALAAPRPRLNGYEGLQSKDITDWSLNLIKSTSETLQLSMDDIRKLPKTEFAFDFKCVEGWSEISHWGGVKFSDFVNHYGLNTQTAMKYVGLNTPDKKYYVGIDMPSALHPQTLLAYEVHGKPLSVEHGAPLRLIIPTKYGIKNLKRIGTIFFSDERPPDYWAEQGYDYFSGL